MPDRLRILHVTASHRWTGAAEPAARLAASQVKAGHEVLFALSGGASFEAEARALGIPVSTQVRFERSYWPHRKLRDLRSLRRLIAEFQPQIVHAHLTHDHVTAGVAIGPRKPGKPILVRTCHREEPPRNDALTQALFTKRTAGVMTISTSMVDHLVDAYRLPAERVCLVRGSVDSDRFRPNDHGPEMRKKWGIAEDAPVLGLVSRMRKNRGFDWLLDAAEDFLPLLPEARLVLCGRGSYKGEVLERLKNHPARDQIVYAGYVSGQDLIDSYNAFDASLMLVPGNDGGCRSALESLACGRPIIGANVGAIRDLLAEGNIGWLVPPENRKDLAETMHYVLSDLEMCRRRGKSGREMVRETHTMEALQQQALSFYQMLMKSA